MATTFDLVTLIDEAASKAGNQARLAELMGVPKSHITQMKQGTGSETAGVASTTFPFRQGSSVYALPHRYTWAAAGAAAASRAIIKTARMHRLCVASCYRTYGENQP